MSNVFILDACALIAFLSGEKGSDRIKNILQEALVAECIIGNGILVTSDHNDFEILEKSENVTINWFR